MLVFVDESGDTGFKFGRGSSDRFVVTAVCFDDVVTAQDCDAQIGDLRRTLPVSPEFKFSNTAHKKRMAFFNALRSVGFYYYAVVFNKAGLYGGGFRYRRSFYKTAVKYTMTLIGDKLKNAKITLDKTGEKAFTKSMQGYLKKHTRREDGTARIRKVRAEDSKRNNLLQLADMVCGAVARSFDEAKGDDRYREQLADQERYVQFWPK